MRFLIDNFLDDDVVSNKTYSSQQSAFPASNLYNAQRRSKVWRSNGYFEVVSGENTIVFREQVGVDITATVTAGTYTSATLFIAAIKSALDAAGVATYTVAQSATFRFTITSNLGGGATVFQLIWTDAASADMASLLGFSTAANDTGASTYTADFLRITTGEWLKWDMGISTNPTSFALTGPRNSALKISPTAVIKLQGNETDSWASPSYNVTLSYDDEVISKFSSTGLHTEGLRYWRLLLQDQNPLGYIEIGVVFLGDYYEATRGRVQFPLDSNFIDRSVTFFSEGGQSFSDIRQKTQSFNLSYTGLQLADIERMRLIFDEYQTAVPFFVSMDKDAVYSSNANRMIRYCKFDTAPSYRLESPDNFSMSITLREEL